jgi:hypothetical protein
MRFPADGLVQLFREAGSAHHAAFAAADGDDPDWPEWYAQYLAGPLSLILGIELPVPVLAYDLRSVDREHDRTVRWPEYYATWFRGRYSAV